MTTSHPSRRTLLGVTLGVGLVLTAPLAASAHVTVSPDDVSAPGSALLTFAFTHGCDHSPTTSLQIQMPEGLTSVSPTADAAWDVSLSRGDNGLVETVTYTAVTPVPNELRGAVSMAVRVAEDAPSQLAFPVIQECEGGTEEWVEIPAEGQDPHDLAAPAPVLSVTAGGADHGHGQSDASANATAQTVSWALGGAGLIAGLAALFVALGVRRQARN